MTGKLVGSLSGCRCGVVLVSVALSAPSESILVSCGCHNRLAQIWWQKITAYSLTVLEARSLTSRCCQGLPPSQGSREESFLSNPSFWQLPVLLGLWPHHSNLCFCGHIAPSLLSNFPLPHSFKDMLLNLGPTQVIQGDRFTSRSPTHYIYRDPFSR